MNRSYATKRVLEVKQDLLDAEYARHTKAEIAVPGSCIESLPDFNGSFSPILAIAYGNAKLNTKALVEGTQVVKNYSGRLVAKMPDASRYLTPTAKGKRLLAAYKKAVKAEYERHEKAKATITREATALLDEINLGSDKDSIVAKLEAFAALKV